ncbi:hypothetical protein CBFG_04505 [Clostridiales bacterium 1_7_47FAA]|nr:hypothetical protein CBFG_04505 [Clostridiales bacterium 1_7_47FAA]
MRERIFCTGKCSPHPGTVKARGRTTNMAAPQLERPNNLHLYMDLKFPKIKYAIPLRQLSLI